MFIGDTLPFVKTYVEEVDTALRTLDSRAGLTTLRKAWLGFCLLAIMVTNSVCWKRFERASLGRWSHTRLSWLFRQPQRFWQHLLRASVLVLIKQYGLTTAIVVFDDSEKPRSKITRRIYKAHKLRDKKSGGTVNGQSFVLLLLVTPLVTLPAGVEFYMPDPAVTAWNKRDRELKQQGVPAKARPPKPPKNRVYPTKQEIALSLLEEFRTHFPQITITCVPAQNARR